MSKKSISFINFNTMGLCSFDSIKGFWHSLDLNERHNKIAQLLHDENSDIIALQEVHTYSFLNILKSKLKKYPYIAYKPLFYGPRGSLVIFSKIPFEKIEYIDFKDRGSILNTSIVAILRRSGMLKVKLKNLSSYVFNVHLTQNGDFLWDDKSRFYRYIKSQLNQITNQIQEIIIHNKNAHIFAIGDFNTDKESGLYNTFIKTNKLTDIFDKATTPSMHQNFLPLKKQARRIDYIFHTHSKEKLKIFNKKELFKEKILLSKTKLRYLSDHIGLRADVKF